MPSDPRSASQPIHDVEVRLDVRIRMSDGLELSANLWLPLPRPGADDERFPAILEILPYRKDDWHRPGDERRGRWLAARGFALCRLDVRGTGSSPGIAEDEYTARETQDGYETVEWLAAQPWSNGNVGMWGISYGGFTRSRSPSCARRTSGRSSRCTPPTTAISTTSTTSAAA